MAHADIEIKWDYDKKTTEAIFKKMEDEWNKALLSTPSKFITGIDLTNPVVVTTETTKEEETPKLQDKWIWVEGYKGTNKDMQGHGNYQFEVGKRYDMPTDVEIKECHAGFHLSLNMKDVFKHYNIGDGHRFFKVKALVRERDLNAYGTYQNDGWFTNRRDKLVSQSIEFIRELTPEEVFQDTEWAHWSEEYKKMAMETNPGKVMDIIKTDELIKLGYSRPFATYIVKEGRYETAKAVGSQPDLSMDMKALMIMKW